MKDSKTSKIFQTIGLFLYVILACIFFKWVMAITFIGIFACLIIWLIIVAVKEIWSN